MTNVYITSYRRNADYSILAENFTLLYGEFKSWENKLIFGYSTQVAYDEDQWTTDNSLIPDSQDVSEIWINVYHTNLKTHNLLVMKYGNKLRYYSIQNINEVIIETIL